MVAISGFPSSGQSPSQTRPIAGFAAAPQTNASSATTQPQSDTVSINPSIDGHSHLMSRIFHSPSDAKIPVETVDQPGAIASHFLTTKDRSQIAILYEYASTNSIDLAHVDALAMDLAYYRQSGGTPVGQRFDADGYGVTYNFFPPDEKVASRVLSGTLINDTSLDHGFIKNLLDPNQSPTHVSDFKFLEKAMSVLSPSGGNDVSPRDVSEADQYFDKNTVWGYGEHHIFEKKLPNIKLDLATGNVIRNPQASGGGNTFSSNALLADPGGLQEIKSRSVQYLLDNFSKEALAPTKDHTRQLAGIVGADLYAKLQSLK